MKANSIKNNITYFLLVIFLLMKMTGLHVLSHSDDNHDDDHAITCTICDHAVLNNLTPALAPDFSEYTLEYTAYNVEKEREENYKFSVLTVLSKDQLFSRPPPVLS